MATPHIESKYDEIASVVLMPGDPNRAKYIADNYLENVNIVNKVRGMNAYTGIVISVPFLKRKVMLSSLCTVAVSNRLIHNPSSQASRTRG